MHFPYKTKKMKMEASINSLKGKPKQVLIHSLKTEPASNIQVKLK